MADNITSEEYRAEIAMLNHEIFELQKQLEKKKEAEFEDSLLDKFNPFDNPTDYPDYSGDYTDIVPQIAVPGCKIPVEPNKNEKKRLRTFYNIGGISLICHLVFSNTIAIALFAVLTLIIRFKNPDASNTAISDYMSNSSISIAVTAIVYLAANVLFAFMGLKMAKMKPLSLIQTRDFSFPKAVQYCFSAVFIQYAASIFTVIFSDIFEKYGFDTSSAPDLTSSGAGYIIMILYSCIIAPITEELLFRGMLLKTFSRANQRFAVVATAIFFGLAHGNLPQFMLAFLLGIFLAHITLKHNSILPSIITHIFINSSATIINYFYENYNSNIVLAIINMIYMLISMVGLIMFIEFSLKNKLPRTTPQQSRRGFAIAKTSLPVITAFILFSFVMIIEVLSSRL